LSNLPSGSHFRFNPILFTPCASGAWIDARD